MVQRTIKFPLSMVLLIIIGIIFTSVQAEDFHIPESADMGARIDIAQNSIAPNPRLDFIASDNLENLTIKMNYHWNKYIPLKKRDLTIAIPIANKAYEIIEKGDIAKNYINQWKKYFTSLGNRYRLDMNFKEAMIWYRKSLKLADKTDIIDTENLFIIKCYHELIKQAYEKDNIQEMIKLYQEIYNQYNNYKISTSYTDIILNLVSGESLYYLNNYTAAKNRLDIVSKFLKNIDRIDQCKTYLLQFLCHIKLGETEDAINSFMKATKIMDSSLNFIQKRNPELSKGEIFAILIQEQDDMFYRKEEFAIITAAAQQYYILLDSADAAYPQQ